MQLVPTKIDGAIVINLVDACNTDTSVCGLCSDCSVAVHNLLLSTELRYVIIDLQDEKDVCPNFIEELLQLRKRLSCPFLFAGVMDKSQKVFESYGYTSDKFIFETPELAIEFVRSLDSSLFEINEAGINFGQNVPVSRPRNSVGQTETAEVEI